MDSPPSHALAASPPTSPLSNAPSSGLFESASPHSTHAHSIQPMGQADSTLRPHTPPQVQAQAQPTLSQPSPAQPAGRYKFGWPGRRKKSEDFSKVINVVGLGLNRSTTAPPASPSPSSTTPAASWSRGRSKELSRLDPSLSQADGELTLDDLSRIHSRSSGKQHTFQFASNALTALKGKLNASQSSIHSHQRPPATPPLPISPPPPLPSKADYLKSPGSIASSSQVRSSVDSVALDGKDAPVSVLEESEKKPELVSVPTATDDDSAKLPQRRERRPSVQNQTAKEIAEDWRKSDSTLRTVRLVGSKTPRPLSLAESTNSGHTVLQSPTGPGVSTGMVAGKRLSALITDVDFGLPEEESEDEPEIVSVPPPPSSFNTNVSMHDVRDVHQHSMSAGSSRSASPACADKPTSRRASLSIRIGRRSGSKSRNPSNTIDPMSGSESLSSSFSSNHGLHTANSSTTSVTSSPKEPEQGARPSVEIASTSSINSGLAGIRAHKYAQYNSKLEPWISAHKASDSQTSLSTSSSHAGSLYRDPESHTNNHHDLHTKPLSSPRGPTIRPAHQRSRLQSIQSKGFRQTAVSLTTGLTPGFAKKAVDKLGRALAGSATNLSSGPEVSAPSQSQIETSHHTSASATSFFGMMNSNHHHHSHPQQNMRLHQQRQHHTHGQSLVTTSPPVASKKALRRHAHVQGAPSGTWSISSSATSASEAESSSLTGQGQGPNLGTLVRGARLGVKGLVFGRDLALCVDDTGIMVDISDVPNTGESGAEMLRLNLEGRKLPALVVRCAQHIVKWGVQEEGLFRISGRSTHVSKLRTEFDSGADYDLRECGPGEIDPHAVSSILKAYLRELPEPLLTRSLMPYFEAALTAENNSIAASDSQSSQSSVGLTSHSERGRGPGLPSNPRDSAQLRKAPSLSTFAVPTLAPRAASETLLHAMASLIARLPQVNRDLLRTVTELIMDTAQRSKETKMPLSNLLLVFCPSLVMSPPLLRVLCEGKGIWDGPPSGTQIPVFGMDVKLHSGRKEVDLNEDERKDTLKSISENKPIERPTVTLRTPEPTSTAIDLSSPTLNSRNEFLLGAPFTINSPNSITIASSVDSLRTPSSAGVSPVAASLRSQSDLPSPFKTAIRKSLIGNPIPFPLGIGYREGIGGSSAPVTPIEQQMPNSQGRMSSYSSSSPNLQATANDSPVSSLHRRKSKASMHGLITKRSLSSLLGFAQTQGSARSSPRAVVTEMTIDELGVLRSSTVPCPVLDLPFEEGNMKLGLELGLPETPLEKQEFHEIEGENESNRSSESDSLCVARPQADVVNRTESDSSAFSTSVFYTPPTTARSLVTPGATYSMASSGSSGSGSSSGKYSLLDFEFGRRTEEEEWAKSVLQAATGA